MSDREERRDGASADDHSAGFGYGNQIKIAHHGGYHSFYAHLDSVAVRIGQRVTSGERIGTMGRSGRAGTRHLHFSLHGTPSAAPGATANEPIEHLVALDANAEQPRFHAMGGGEFIGSPDAFWTGRLYASENDSTHPTLLGAPPAVLRDVITERARGLRTVLDRRARLAAIVAQKGARSVDWIATELASVLTEDGDHAVALYLQATDVDMARAHWASAEQMLLQSLRANGDPRRFEPWLPGRALFQLGVLARRRGDALTARQYFVDALHQSTSAELAADAREELSALRASEAASKL